MKRAVAVLAVLSAALILTTPASAVPFLSVTADHLGGGLIQYTLNANNNLGGAIAVQITVRRTLALPLVPVNLLEVRHLLELAVEEPDQRL